MAATARAPLHFNFGLTSDVDRDTIPVRRKLPTSGAACRFLIVVPHLKDSEKGRGKELQLLSPRCSSLDNFLPTKKKSCSTAITSPCPVFEREPVTLLAKVAVPDTMQQPTANTEFERERNHWSLRSY